MSLRLSSICRRLVAWLAMALFLLAALFPIYWMLITSLKRDGEIHRLVPTFWPQKFDLSGYTYLFEKTKFFQNLSNTVMIALIVATISVVLATMAAYAIARIDFKGRGTLSKSLFVAYIMPKTLLFIPVYVMLSRMQLTNDIRGLIFIYPSLTMPYAAWMLTSYFKTIPYEIEEAAIIDGCSRIGCMLRIIVPLSLPGILSVFVFCISICWSEYLYALIIVTKRTQMTISICLSQLIVGDMIRWSPISAGAIISTTPIIVLYMLCSKYFTGGFTAGSVKG